MLDTAGKIVSILTPWGAIAYIASQLFGAVSSLAGLATFADIGIKLLGDFRISEAIAYIFGVGSMIYGYNERRLRQRHIGKSSAREIALEKKVDPGRSSSKLTQQGTTRPEDRP